MSIPPKIGSDFLNHYASRTGREFDQDILINIWNMYVYITNEELKNIKPYTDLSRNPRFVMVGDVHGSFLQLLTPLIQYGFINNVRLHEIRGPIENVDIGSLISFKFHSTNSNQKKYLPYLIYLGDIVDHSIHGMDLLLVRILMDLIQMFGYNIYWCFGNHDMALYYTMIGSKIDIKNTFNVSEYEIKAYSKLIGYESFKNTFIHFVKNRDYEYNILIYYCKKGEITCSHISSDKTINNINYHHLNDIFKNNKQNDEDLLKQLFVSDDFYSGKTSCYYGHTNQLSRKIKTSDFRADKDKAVKAINDLREDIKNKKLYCCDLGASTFSMFVNKNLWGYEFITHVALHPGSSVPIRCPTYVVNYTTILEICNIH
jgi:hypothetical protein